MRTLAVALAAAATLALVAAGAPAVASHVIHAHGIAARLPLGWHSSTRLFSDCSDPTQRLVLTSARRPLRRGREVAVGAALVLVLEEVSASPTPFPRRRHFLLPSSGLMGGCCAMPVGRGFELFFRDHGRNLYAFVYARKRALLEQALEIVNSLEVERTA